jgi:hypothetical protein
MTANALDSYLLHLTSRKAFHLFFIALVIGSLSTWYEVGLPLVPALVVVIYGSLLLYSAKSLLVSHSEMTNNSPYFLGFLLFLVALLSTFSRVVNDTQGIDIPRVFRQLGTALIATIVGLPFRQALFAYAPGQQDQDTFYRNLEEELRRSASEFRKSQAELLEMLRLFIETRQTLFTDEERASRQYVGNLTKAAEVFDDLNSRYPQIIATALSDTTTTIVNLSNRMRTFNDEVLRFEPRFIGDVSAEVTRVKASFESLARDSATLSAALVKLETTVQEVPSKTTAVFSDLKLNADTIAADLRTRVEAIQKDLSGIDAVLTEFIAVSSERISQLR